MQHDFFISVKEKLSQYSYGVIFCFFIFLFSFALFGGNSVYTAPSPRFTPNIITYQGKLTESGVAVTTTKNFGFLIYDASSGGNLLYTASGTLNSTSTVNITPSQGIFSIDLGGDTTNELTSSTFSENTNLYLEVWVGNTKLTPRKHLTATPFALNSQFLLGISPTTTSSGLYIPHSDEFGNFTFTGNPQSDFSGGVVYINPGSVDGDRFLFSVAVNGSDKFHVDSDGDIFVNGGLIVSSTLRSNGNNIFSYGTTSLATSTFAGNLTVSRGGNVPFFVDSINNRVGISSSSPAFPLSVVGQSYFSATSTVQDIQVLDGIVLGGVKRSTWSSADVIASANNTFSGNNSFTGNNTFSGLNTFTSTTNFTATTTFSTTTIAGLLNVDNGVFVADTINNRVGVNSSTPGYALSVDGTSYFSQTSTFVGPTNFYGKISHPTILGTLSNSNLGGITAVTVRGKYAYVTAGLSDAMQIIDISNPSNMVALGTITNGTNGISLDQPNGIFVAGNYAYVTSISSDSLCVIDISNPSSPTYESCIRNGDGKGASLLDPINVFVSGNYAYIAVASSAGLEIVDISNPRDLRHAGRLLDGTAGSGMSGARNIFVSGKYAYIVAGDGGTTSTFTVIDVSDPRNPKRLSYLAHGTGGAVLNYPTGIYISGRYAYVTSFSGSALEIIDISNPTAVSHVSTLLDGSGGAVLNQPTTVMVSGNYAYLSVATSAALEIVDITSSTRPMHHASVVDTSLQSAYSVFLSNNKAYLAGYSQNNLVAVDIQGITSPNAEIGTLSTNGVSVSDFLNVEGNAYIRNGLSVGNNGLSLGGDLSFNTNTTTVSATNTIAFSNTARFLSIATTTRNNLFVFDTINKYNQSSASSTYLLSVRNNGLSAFSVASNGDVAASGTLFANSAAIGTPGSPGDLAERIDIAVDDMVEPGDVVVVDPHNTDTYRRSSGPYEQAVAGVISTNPSLVIGYGQTNSTAVMALVGRVPIKVSTENGPIRRGDVLVTASSTGYAMRYDASKDDETKVVGIIGVALESLDEGSGKIMGLVRTGWVNSRHKTIADIQQELTVLSEAQSLQGHSSELNVIDANGQLAFLSNDLDAAGHSIFNIKRLAGKDGKWEVDEQGRFITRLTTRDGEKSLYSLQSGETEFVFSGSAQLQSGVARVDFDATSREIIDGDKPIKINITLTSEANGVFIGGKDATGFVVKELQNGTSNATFDYVVIASRKSQAAISAQNNNTPLVPEQAPVLENTPPVLPVESPSAESSSSTPPVEEPSPVVEEPPAAVEAPPSDGASESSL